MINHLKSNMKNIIIIIFDAFRSKNSSMFGYQKGLDKNLMSLSKESIFFKNHISCANATLPSLTSLFTAKYPPTHGIIHSIPYTKPQEYENLKKNKFWFPSYLKNKGYHTIGIDWLGLWLKRGFDYYQEIEAKEKPQTKLQKFMRISLIKKTLLALPGWLYKLGKRFVKTRSSKNFPNATQVTNLAIEQLNKSKKPFFLFMHYIDPHFPYLTMKNPPQRGKKDINLILKKAKSQNQREYIKKRIVDVGLNSTSDIKNKYNLAIQYTDREIGRLINHLKKENLWDNTIFIVLADHGVSLTEHNIFFSHSGLYDETIHVPLLMKFPDIKGKEIDGLVQNIDIIPTIMDYMKWGKVKGFEGKSALPLIKNKKPIRNKTLSYDSLAEDVIAVRTKTKKLITAKNGFSFLDRTVHHRGKEKYDLVKDPDELHNLISRKEIKFF